ncbi:MAG: hypothetical protein GY778_06710 [bacterium]|nr:hypothetical protein [bacterium]
MIRATDTDDHLSQVYTRIGGRDRTGIRMGRWAWGAMFVDLNNYACDGIVIPNGFLTNPAKDDL